MLRGFPTKELFATDALRTVLYRGYSRFRMRNLLNNECCRKEEKVLGLRQHVIVMRPHLMVSGYFDFFMRDFARKKSHSPTLWCLVRILVKI